MTTKPLNAKIQWHCRRGMLELDLLLLPFFQYRFEQLSPHLQEDFIKLLDCSDPDIYNWYLGAETPPLSLQPIIEQLRDYVATQH